MTSNVTGEEEAGAGAEEEDGRQEAELTLEAGGTGAEPLLLLMLDILLSVCEALLERGRTGAMNLSGR